MVEGSSPFVLASFQSPCDLGCRDSFFCPNLISGLRSSAQSDPWEELRDHEPPDPDIALFAWDEVAGIDAQGLCRSPAGVVIRQQEAESEIEPGGWGGGGFEQREGGPWKRYLVDGAA